MDQKSCCAPARAEKNTGKTQSIPQDPNASVLDTVAIPGGQAFVGTDNPVFAVDGEGPLKRQKIKPFRLTPTSITNAQFAAFVEATGYVTEAETFGWTFVFNGHLRHTTPATQGVVGTEWWRRVDGANWRKPFGPHGSDCLADHPVVQVSWHDARAFAAWAGGRLPTEAEWEHAARGGQEDVMFPWGDIEPDEVEHLPCNIWQGQFPSQDRGLDGYTHSAPARSFAPNSFGLYHMVGNVWDWVADPFKVKSLKKTARQQQNAMRGFKVIKGGSYLCHKSYCFRYRIAARTGNSPDSATTHMGFRVAFSA